MLFRSGEGNDGSFGGPPGGLYIVLHVRPHEMFRREGYDLILQAPISFVQAALGARLTIPTLTGSQELAIPPGTQPDEVIRLKGEGVAYPKGSRRGDLLVQVKVVIPRDLNPRQKEMLQEFAQEAPEQQTTTVGGSTAPGEEEGLISKLWHTVKDWTHKE